jgi:hypothetical protein
MPVLREPHTKCIVRRDGGEVPGRPPVGLFGWLFNFHFAEVLLLLANANMIGTTLALDTLRHSHFPVQKCGTLSRRAGLAKFSSDGNCVENDV